MKEKKVVIITGAAGGIGSAMAVQFAAKGFALVLVDIDGAGLDVLAGRLPRAGSEVLLLQGDIGEDAFLKVIVQRAKDRWGRIDVLVNNAVWRELGTLRSLSVGHWERTIRVGLTAAVFLTKYVAAVMEKKRSGGLIVNMSSVLAHRPGGISPAYNICKGGLETLTYESAVLYGPAGIRVVAISPGNIRTKLSGDYKDAQSNDISGLLSRDMDEHTPLGRSGAPEEIARVVCWLATEEASFITGVCLPVDGGFLHNFNSYRMKKKQFPAEF